MNGSLKNWFELMRISNLPTVLSSALVGVFMLTPLVPDPVLMLGVVLPSILAIASFYLGGFVMNDVFDVEIDRVERPSRPLPSGRISMLQAGRAGMLLLGGGLVLVLVAELVSARFQGSGKAFTLAFPYGLVAAGLLVVLILLYDRFHARNSAWVVVMGACRAMVYVTCLLTVTDQLLEVDPHPLVMKYLGWPNIVSLPTVPFVVSMGLYVACFSRIARGEVETGDESGSMPRATRILCLAGTLLPVVVLLGVKIVGGIIAIARSSDGMGNAPLFRVDMVTAIISCSIVAVWFVVAIRAYLADPRSPRRPIQMWIAGIALLDGLYLFLYGQGILSIACLLLFAFTIWGHRRIRGT